MNQSQTFLLAIFWIVGLSVSVPYLHAEQPGPSPEKDLKLSTSQPPLTPLPEASMIAKDADWVVAEIERRERDEKLIREEIVETHRWPNLEYDVVNGIQSRNANRALGRP